MNPPFIQPTATESLKKIVRGLFGSINGACRLVFEKTAICDSTGTCSASSTDRRSGLQLAGVQLGHRIVNRRVIVVNGRIVQQIGPVQAARQQ